MRARATKGSRSVQRPEEIYRCLLTQYDLPRLMKKFPAVREIRTAFHCGQAVATEALNRLAEHYHFKRTPRGKTRLKLDFSNAGRNFGWYDYLYQRRECAIVFQQDIAFCWQPIVEEYNREHPNRPIRSHLVCYVEEFRRLTADSAIDLVLLPNHPCLVGLRKGLAAFQDLTPLAKSLPTTDYYPSAFLHDNTGQLRGIAPALVPKLLFFRPNVGQIPLDGMKMSALPALLRKIKQGNPGLLYAAVFDSYLHFLSNCGLDPSVSLARGFSDCGAWEEQVDLFRQMCRDKLVPSVCDLVNSGYPFFADGQSAMMEMYYSKIPRFVEDGGLDFALPPLAPGTPYSVVSEVLGICQGSIRYEQAWEFIEFILQPRVQQLLLSRMNAFSVLRKVRPIGMPETVWRRVTPMLENAVRRRSDNIMAPSLFRCFESGIDCLVKYGRSFRHFLEDFLVQYNLLKEGGVL
ncbi:MAG: hypothetical protein IJJ33_07520 [Victivallales bacterium]|nr:hypothetical protein [Victivallales bacterium]